jgi:hypothetical protein
MAYTRNWLKEQIAGYLKDASVGVHLDTWIDIGAKRVSRVLECPEMEYELFNSLTIPIDSGLDGGNASASNLIIVDGGDAFSADPSAAPRNYIIMPDRLVRLVVVQTLTNGEWRALRSVPKHNAFNFKGTGTPEVYYVEKQRIYPVPFNNGEFRSIYLTEVEIPVGDGETPALTSYPFVFLYAALSEAYDWKQDAEMNARYESKWIRDAEFIRSIYRGEQSGETPAIRAM